MGLEIALQAVIAVLLMVLSGIGAAFLATAKAGNEVVARLEESMNALTMEMALVKQTLEHLPPASLLLRIDVLEAHMSKLQDACQRSGISEP